MPRFRYFVAPNCLGTVFLSRHGNFIRVLYEGFVPVRGDPGAIVIVLVFGVGNLLRGVFYSAPGPFGLSIVCGCPLLLFNGDFGMVEFDLYPFTRGWRETACSFLFSLLQLPPGF